MVQVFRPAPAKYDSGFLNRTRGDHRTSSCTWDRLSPAGNPRLRPPPRFAALSPGNFQGISSGAYKTQRRREGLPPNPHCVHGRGSASARKASWPSSKRTALSSTATVSTSLWWQRRQRLGAEVKQAKPRATAFGSTVLMKRHAKRSRHGRLIGRLGSCSVVLCRASWATYSGVKSAPTVVNTCRPLHKAHMMVCRLRDSTLGILPWQRALARLPQRLHAFHKYQVATQSTHASRAVLFFRIFMSCGAHARAPSPLWLTNVLHEVLATQVTTR